MEDMLKHLELLVLAQALSDVLRAELGLEKVTTDEEFDELTNAYSHLASYPTIRERLAKKAQYKEWLEKVEEVLNEPASC
jgi:hypothetical protein